MKDEIWWFMGPGSSAVSILLALDRRGFRLSDPVTGESHIYSRMPGREGARDPIDLEALEQQILNESTTIQTWVTATADVTVTFDYSHRAIILYLDGLDVSLGARAVFSITALAGASYAPASVVVVDPDVGDFVDEWVEFSQRPFEVEPPSKFSLLAFGSDRVASGMILHVSEGSWLSGDLFDVGQ